ncbi:hypothetical protein FAVG1_02800 [Fusarium avenaceum]|nr:hypothetical protein DER45DRAFT_646482 [Fusarium avenaceum]KIL94238.1 hypothetical protein FAVG1_02800 [Fusarium avenaceum]
MSDVQNESPTTIDANTELLWPDDLPDAPQFQEANNSPKTSTCTELESDESQHWTEIMAEQAARLSVVRRLSVKRWAEPLYNDLPNSEINWELDGPHTVCRVVGLSCYGRDYKKVHGLKIHLGSQPHRDYDASLAKASPILSVAVVPKRATIDQISPVPPK